jgi:hypothetical protein
MESEGDYLECAQDRKADEGYKDIESNFYLNDSLNDDLESKF